MNIRAGAAFATLLLATASVNAAGPFGSIHVGNWRGGAYTNDTTGAFSHCAAGATYIGGVYFAVSVTSAGGWSLGFAHQAWQLTIGETIPIDLTFDNRNQFHVFGTPITSNLVEVPMPINSELIAAFRSAHGMAAFAKGQLYQFELKDTSRLLPALTTCVAQAKRGVNTVGKIEPEAVTKRVAPVSSLSPNSTEAIPSPELQIEAVQLASNFIIRANLHNPRVLSRADTPVEFASFGAAWKADEGQGAVKIIAPNGNVKGIDVAAAVAAGDSKACGGKFASGRVSELVDSDVVFRGFASCEDSNGTRVAEYFIVPRQKGGFIMFSVVVNGKSGQSPALTQTENLTTLRKAALVSAGE
jgi:hypothetical protein